MTAVVQGTRVYPNADGFLSPAEIDKPASYGRATNPRIRHPTARRKKKRGCIVWTRYSTPSEPSPQIHSAGTRTGTLSPSSDSSAAARRSDAQAPAYYASVAGAAAAHAGVVRGTCPASSVGNANLPGPDPVTPVNDGPAGAAVMVSRPKADDDLIVAAAGRAAKMHQDALDLIAAGDAVADDAPAPAVQ